MTDDLSTSLHTTRLAESMAAQPDELDRLAAVDLGTFAERLLHCRHLWLVGTGSSQHAAELGALLLAEHGLDAHACGSLEFVRRAPARGDDGVVVVSHSGKTASARAARLQSGAIGAVTIGVTGPAAGWPDAIETTSAEASETASVSYTATVLMLARLAAALSGDAELDAQAGSVGGLVRSALAESATDGIRAPERALVIAGVGAGAVTAREGALKLREAARLLAEGYEAEYLLHGSAVPLDHRDHLVLLAPDTHGPGLLEAIGEAAEAAGVGTTTVEQQAFLHPVLDQIPLTARLQSLALRLAVEGGQDPDTVIVGRWRQPSLWRIGAPTEARAE